MEADTILNVEEQAELVLPDTQITELDRQHHDGLSEEQRRLARALADAEGWREFMLQEARWRTFLERLAAHFPGIGPALVTVAAHIRSSQVGFCCCELPEGSRG